MAWPWLFAAGAGAGSDEGAEQQRKQRDTLLLAQDDKGDTVAHLICRGIAYENLVVEQHTIRGGGIPYSHDEDDRLSTVFAWVLSGPGAQALALRNARGLSPLDELLGFALRAREREGRRVPLFVGLTSASHATARAFLELGASSNRIRAEPTNEAFLAYLVNPMMHLLRGVVAGHRAAATVTATTATAAAATVVAAGAPTPPLSFSVSSSPQPLALTKPAAHLIADALLAASPADGRARGWSTMHVLCAGGGAAEWTVRDKGGHPIPLLSQPLHLEHWDMYSESIRAAAVALRAGGRLADAAFVRSGGSAGLTLLHAAALRRAGGPLKGEDIHELYQFELERKRARERKNGVNVETERTDKEASVHALPSRLGAVLRYVIGCDEGESDGYDVPSLLCPGCPDPIYLRHWDVQRRVRAKTETEARQAEEERKKEEQVQEREREQKEKQDQKEKQRQKRPRTASNAEQASRLARAVNARALDGEEETALHMVCAGFRRVDAAALHRGELNFEGSQFRAWGGSWSTFRFSEEREGSLPRKAQSIPSQIAKLLRVPGIDIAARTRSGLTALQISMLARDWRAVHLLVSHDPVAFVQSQLRRMGGGGEAALADGQKRARIAVARGRTTNVE